MRVFIAGVMQGSRTDDAVNDQDYRTTIADIVRSSVDDVHIIDPWALHPNSETYDTQNARDTFFDMTAAATESDVVVAYVPEASMGTAIEMWEAHRCGVPVFTISKMSANWVVKLLSTEVFPSLEEFRRFAISGGLTATRPPV